jgi:hypothetical protein
VTAQSDADFGGDIFLDIGHVSFATLAREIGAAPGLQAALRGDADAR